MTPLHQATRSLWKSVDDTYAAALMPYDAEPMPLDGGLVVMWGACVAPVVRAYVPPPGTEFVVLAGRTLGGFEALGVGRDGLVVCVTGSDRDREPSVYGPKWSRLTYDLGNVFERVEAV